MSQQTAPKERRCQERLREINEYLDLNLDDEIDDALCDEIERHMEKCPDCQLIVDTLTRTIKMYHSLAKVQVEFPNDVENRLLQRLNLPV